jgi:hypothetical protein
VSTSRALARTRISGRWVRRLGGGARDRYYVAALLFAAGGLPELIYKKVHVCLKIRENFFLAYL